jgi:hypothetical protein
MTRVSPSKLFSISSKRTNALPLSFGEADIKEFPFEI